MERQRTGPGRPRKYGEDLKKFQTHIPESVYDKLWGLKEKLDLSFAELLLFLVDHANWSVIELQAKITHQEEYIKQLEKEKQALLEEREKLLTRIEKLELENQALKQGRSVRSYQDALKLKELAKHAREGVSWKALCAEVLGLRDEGKIKDLMKLAFVVRKNERNAWPSKFYPKDIATEFHGWVLKRPDAKVADIIDYVLYREDTLKAAKGLAVGEAAKEKAPEVKPLKTGKAAERWIEMFFDVVEREYMSLLDQGRGKDAKRYLEKAIPEKLEKVLQDINPEDWRRAILAVLEEMEAKAEGNARAEAFVSNLRRVALRASNEFSRAPVMEVTSDV